MANTQTGTFDDPEDLLDQFRTFIITQADYTELYYAAEGDGQRFHFTKTTGAETYYFNMRAMVDEALPNNPWSTAKYYGLLMNDSTSFDISDLALMQDGAYISQDVPYGGNILCDSSTGKDYRFCADGSFFSITIDGYSDYQQHMIGTSSNAMHGVLCSGTFLRESNLPEDDSTYNLIRFLNTSSSVLHWGCSVIDSLGVRYEMAGGSIALDSLRPIYGGVTQIGYIGKLILNYSSNPNLGKPALLPFILAYGPSTDVTQADGVSGVAVLNKTYLNNGEIIAIDGESWVIYEANSTQPNYGIAFKIS